MSYWQDPPRVSTAFTYRGLDAVLLENRHLRIMVLPEKGGDILEFRDKRSDVDVLYHADHPWDPPAERPIPSTETSWNEHYAGGWQLNLPIAGGPMEIPGSHYGLHGESALIPWDVSIVQDDAAAVTIELTASLRRYPFDITRELTLPADERALRITESVTNTGKTPVEYVWQHHVALGRPIIGPEATLDVPAEVAYIEEYGDDHASNRLVGGQTAEWPMAEGIDGTPIDLSTFPPVEAEIHDQAFLDGVDEGWYAVTNPKRDVGFVLSYPSDHFESLWYWQAFGGFHEAPFWGRNYTAGLEPTTAYPGHSLPDAQRENGTINTMAPGETTSVELVARTYHGLDRVRAVNSDGVPEGAD